MSQKKNSLELLFAEYCKPLDKYSRPSKASGASTEAGDTSTSSFITCCKQNLTKKNWIIKDSDWNKLLNEIPIGSLRIPIAVRENQNHKILIALDIKDFFSICYQVFLEGNKK